MALYCPNKSSDQWKRLVRDLGEERAYGQWHLYYGPKGGQLVTDSVTKGTTEKTKSKKLSELGKAELKLGLRLDTITQEEFYPRSNYTEFSKAREKARDLNKNELVGSQYQAEPMKRIGEGGQELYAVKLTIDKAYRTPDKDPEEANDELDAFLKKRMSELGVSVEAHETLKDRMGNEVLGVADTYRHIIQVAQNKRDKMTLPEETSHFLIEMMKDNKMVQRMLDLARESSEYNEVYEEYKNNKDYQDENGDVREDKIAKETAGKLLGEKIIKEFEKGDTSDKMVGLMRRIWNRFLSFFKRGNDKEIQSEIDRVFGGVAEKIISGELEGFDTSILKKGKFYRQGDNEGMNAEEENKPLVDFEKSLDKSIKAIDKKIKVNKAKGVGSKKFFEREESLLKDLVEDKNVEEYLKGNIRFLREINKETENIIGSKRVGKRNPNKEEKKGKFKEIEEEINSGNPDMFRLASRLRDIKNYIGSYEGIIGTVRSELRSNDQIDEKRKEKILDWIKELSDRVDVIKQEYDRVGREIFSKGYLKKYTTNPEANVEGILDPDTPLDDIGIMTRWADSMAEADNDVLKIIDKAVKDDIDKAQDQALKERNKLLKMQKDLVDKGIKDLSFSYERDSEGELTGNIISDVNWHEFEKAKEKFFGDLNEKYGLPQDKKESKAIRNGDLRAVSRWYEANKNKEGMKEYFNKVGAPNRTTFLTALSDQVKKDYGREAAKWFEENQDPNPNAGQLIDKKKEELSEVEFNDWLADNIIAQNDGTKKYVRDLAIPKKEKYKNKDYEKLSQDKKEFIDQIKEMYEAYNKLLPPKFKMGDKETYFLAPQHRKDMMERLKDKGVKTMGSEFKEGFVKTEEEEDFGSIYRLTDEEGKEYKMVPRQHTIELEDKRDLSTDIITSMSLFASMAYNNNYMNKHVDMLELGKDIIAGQSFKKTSAGKNVKQAIGVENEGSYETKPGNESQVYQRLSKYLEMVVYGEKKLDEGGLFGSNIDQAKFLDTLGSYTAINNLALNVYAGFANIGFGNAMLHTESVASEFISRKSLREASKLYSKEAPKSMAQMGDNYRTDWMSAWGDRMDVLQDFKANTYNMNTNRKTWLGHMFKTSSLFFINHAGEHFLQTRLSFALAQEAQVKDKDGNIKSLTDATYVEGNELKFEEGLTKVVPKDDKGNNIGRMWFEEENGEALTEEDIRRFKRKQHFINKRLHGIYNDTDKSVIQQYALGRLALMFRKFMRPGYNRRFGKLQYNEEGEAWTEGYYRTAARFFNILRKDFKEGQFEIRKRWNELNQREKANMMRNLVESSYLIATAVMASILTSIASDDEDDWALNMMAYQANRVYTELAFFHPAQAFNGFSETLRIVQSPAASVDQLQQLIRVLHITDYADQLERGPYKGWNKGLRNLFEATPPLSSLKEATSSSEVNSHLKFFENH